MEQNGYTLNPVQVGIFVHWLEEPDHDEML